MRRLPFSYGPSHLAVVVLVHFVCVTLLVLLSLGNYPPAKPGALGIGPLKAALGTPNASPSLLAA